MPVAAVGDRTGFVGGPDDHVGRAGADLVIAAGAAVGLGRVGAGDGAHQPVTVGAGLGVCPAAGCAEVGLLGTTVPVSAGAIVSGHGKHVNRRDRWAAESGPPCRCGTGRNQAATRCDPHPPGLVAAGQIRSISPAWHVPVERRSPNSATDRGWIRSARQANCRPGRQEKLGPIHIAGFPDRGPAASFGARVRLQDRVGSGLRRRRKPGPCRLSRARTTATSRSPGPRAKAANRVSPVRGPAAPVARLPSASRAGR